VKGTRITPEVSTSGIFRLKIAQKQKTPEKFKFFGSLWGFFVCSVVCSSLLYPRGISLLRFEIAIVYGRSYDRRWTIMLASRHVHTLLFLS